MKLRKKDIQNFKLLMNKAKRKYRRIKKVYNINTNINFNINSKLNNFTQLNNIKSRADYNRLVGNIESFLSSKSTHNRYVKLKSGVAISRAEYNEFKYLSKSINQEKQKVLNRLKDKPFFDYKSYVGQIDNRMGNELFDELRIKKYDVNKYLSRNAIQQKLVTMRQQNKSDYLSVKNKTYKENYVASLKSVYGEALRDVIKGIDKMSMDEFMDLYYSNAIPHVEYNYRKEDWESKYKTIKNYFASVFNE